MRERERERENERLSSAKARLPLVLFLPIAVMAGSTAAAQTWTSLYISTPQGGWLDFVGDLDGSGDNVFELVRLGNTASNNGITVYQYSVTALGGGDAQALGSLWNRGSWPSGTYPVIRWSGNFHETSNGLAIPLYDQGILAILGNTGSGTPGKPAVLFLDASTGATVTTVVLPHGSNPAYHMTFSNNLEANARDFLIVPSKYNSNKGWHVSLIDVTTMTTSSTIVPSSDVHHFQWHDVTTATNSGIPIAYGRDIRVGKFDNGDDSYDELLVSSICLRVSWSPQSGVSLTTIWNVPQDANNPKLDYLQHIAIPKYDAREDFWVLTGYSGSAKTSGLLTIMMIQDSPPKFETEITKTNWNGKCFPDDSQTYPYCTYQQSPLIRGYTMTQSLHLSVIATIISGENPVWMELGKWRPSASSSAPWGYSQTNPRFRHIAMNRNGTIWWFTPRTGWLNAQGTTTGNYIDAIRWENRTQSGKPRIANILATQEIPNLAPYRSKFEVVRYKSDLDASNRAWAWCGNGSGGWGDRMTTSLVMFEEGCIFPFDVDDDGWEEIVLHGPTNVTIYWSPHHTGSEISLLWSYLRGRNSPGGGSPSTYEKWYWGREAKYDR